MRDEAVPHLIRAAGEAAVAAYRSYFESASRTRATRRLYASQAGRFFDWAGSRGLTLETIDAPALAAYAAARASATSPQTANLSLVPIRGVFRILVDSGALAESPSASEISIPAASAADTAPSILQTPEEWQAAVDAADLALTLDSLIQYGLMETTDGDFSVNAARCYEILELGRSLGYAPRRDDGVAAHG